MFDGDQSDRLIVIWTSADREVAMRMVFMYTQNSALRGWWRHVTLVVWGPSQKLLSKDPELQDRILQMKHAGVQVLACKACSDSYELSERLVELGVEVIYMGVPLTAAMQNGAHVLTF
jgi:hypothetical protein